MANVKLKLAGLTCDSCIRNVTNILKGNDYVTNIIDLNLTSAEIEVENSSKEALDSIIEDIVDIGYEASLA